jgi:hypothetical protein
VSEGEAAHLGWVMAPGSREAEGEGGEGFYIAQSGRCPDLLVFFEGGAVWHSVGQNLASLMLPSSITGPQHHEEASILAGDLLLANLS